MALVEQMIRQISKLVLQPYLVESESSLLVAVLRGTTVGVAIVNEPRRSDEVDQAVRRGPQQML